MGRREDNREDRLAEAKKIREALDAGKSKVEVAKAMKIPRRTLYRRLDELEDEGLDGGDT